MGSPRPRVLVVAGHDPTGGAGVDADREALEAHGAEMIEVVTARTDQDGTRVRSIGARDPEAWLAEARTELAREPVAVKSGLLPGADHVRALARLLDELEGIPVVVDPVLSASGGEPFLDDAGVAALVEELLPRGPVLTPNRPEARRLTGLDDPLDAAKALLERGAAAVVLKGGHADEDPVRDLVLERDAEPVWCSHPRVPGRSLHGSGCRHASALAAGLAAGLPLAEAAAAAGRYVRGLLAAPG